MAFDKRKYCDGCVSDYYNYNFGMNKKMGCWQYKTAKIIWMKLVPRDAMPSTYHKFKKRRRPSCYYNPEWPRID